MRTIGQALSPIGQPSIGPYETARRPLVGFAMDYPDGFATPEHSHPRAQLLYAAAGVMRVVTPGAAYLVPPSTALFVPADAPHAIRMDGPVAMRALFLRKEAATRAGKGTAVIAVSPLLREVILAACAEPLEWDLKGRGRYLTQLALDEIARSAALPLCLTMPRDERVRRAVNILLDQPQGTNSLEHLAMVSGASVRTLARLFRTETGLSFRQWRQLARMTGALSVLTAGGSPARAAAIAGFASQSAFGNAFRSLFDMTPGQARASGPGSAKVSFELPPRRDERPIARPHSSEADA